MTFIETPRFPDEVSYGFSGGPTYVTEVLILASGFEQRNALWSQGRCKYDAAHGLKTQAQLDELIAFFRSVKGRTHGFRVKDWNDYTAVQSAGILTLVSSGVYSMQKRYVTGALSEDRRITKPVSLVAVYDNTVLMTAGAYTVTYSLGIVGVTSGGTGGPYTWSGTFDVPCRFETDEMRASIDLLNHYTWGQIPIWETRVSS
jgi:uncharacterized protein (TIGR02217 family)